MLRDIELDAMIDNGSGRLVAPKNTKLDGRGGEVNTVYGGATTPTCSVCKGEQQTDRWTAVLRMCRRRKSCL